MKRFVLLLVAVLVFGSCAQDDADDLGEGFTLTGRITQAQDDVEPEGIPDPLAEADTDLDSDDGGTPAQGGAFVVRADEDVPELADCRVQLRSYTVFYAEETRFLPAEVVEADDFPDGLRGRTVEITGTFYSSEDAETEGDDEETVAPGACALVAETVTVEP